MRAEAPCLLFLGAGSSDGSVVVQESFGWSRHHTRHFCANDCVIAVFYVEEVFGGFPYVLVLDSCLGVVFVLVSLSFCTLYLLSI